MTKPKNLKSKIFLDSGDSKETKAVYTFMRFLDGQTTNPSLVAKNPIVQEWLAKGEKFSSGKIIDFYQEVVQEISDLISGSSVSIEVYADKETSAEKMIFQARKMFTWIPSAHIKLPINKAGLIAAEQLIKEGMRVNMTLCFNQKQAAAVYAATRGAKKGDVFISPFVGRLDDIGLNGMDLIKNIIQMYLQGDGHVEVLTASVRNLNHLVYAIKLESDIITVPLQILREWANMLFPISRNGDDYNSENLREIPYEEISLNKDWQEYDIFHELTDKGIEKFSNDWNKLIKDA